MLPKTLPIFPLAAALCLPAVTSPAAIVINGVLQPDPLVLDASSGDAMAVDGESRVTVVEGGRIEGAGAFSEFGGNSELILDGGSTYQTIIDEFAIFEANSGQSIGTLILDGSADGEINGGVFQTVVTRGRSHLRVNAGDLSGGEDFEIAGDSFVELLGGSFFTTFTNDAPRVEVLGGIFTGEVHFNGAPLGNIYGGSFQDSLSLADTAEFTLYSLDATFSGNRSDPFAVVEGEFVSGTTLRRVSGMLSGTYLDGTPYSFSLSVDHAAMLHIIPEPSALWLAAAAAVSGLSRRRRLQPQTQPMPRSMA